MTRMQQWRMNPSSPRPAISIPLQRFRVLVRCLVAMAIPLLAGCATAPLPEGSALPEGTGTLTYPAKNFSVNSPPPNWHIATKYPKATVAWEEKETHAAIQIFVADPSGLPARVWARGWISVFEGLLQERYPGKATVSIAEETEVDFNGKQFYQVSATWHICPTEGVEVTGKTLMYLLQTRKFDYNLALTAVLGFYEQHRPVLEQMARSFVYVE
jgi:hypothetical protein